MESDVRRAKKILDKFCPPGTTQSLDKVIPSSVMRRAKGIAIFTVYRLGFLMSARAGTGVVLAKLPNGEWSAPTAIGIGGLGGGFNAGAEMVDFLIVLNSRAAVRSFMSAGSLQLGGNLALALGPLGRSGEASAAMNAEMKMAAMFSYSMSRGLYGGVTIEGTVLLDRPEANARTYGAPLKPDEILTGHVDPPAFTMPLVTRLEEITGSASADADLDDTWDDSLSESGVPPRSTAAYAPSGGAPTRRAAPRPPRTREYMDDLDAQLQSTSLESADAASLDDGASPREAPSYVPRRAAPQRGGQTRFGAYAPGAAARERPRPASMAGAFPHVASYAPRPSGGARPAARMPEAEDEDPFADQDTPTAGPAADARSPTAPTTSCVPYKPRTRRPRANPTLVDLEDELDAPLADPLPAAGEAPAGSGARAGRGAAGADRPAGGGVLPTSLLEGDLVVALHDFAAQEPSDLSFKKGDIVRVLRRTDNASDWWTGELAAAFGAETKSGLFPSNYTEPL